MFGGNASDWKMSDTWDGTKYNLVDSNGNPVKNYGLSGYKPIEWVPVNPEAPPYYWPKTPEEAAKYFFPDQEIDPKFLSQNEYGGWHLSEDHWMFDGAADKFLTLHPGEVAEGYYVGEDGLMKTQDDRVWVAFGGKKDGPGGVIISAKGQGMTIWMPGTDPNKIALEAGNEYNTSTHYRGPSGDKLGPDPINFIPIYNAPGFDEIGFNTNRLAPGKLIAQIPVVPPTEKLKAQLPLSAGTGPSRVTSVSQLGSREVSFQKNPFKGLTVGNVYNSKGFRKT